MSADSRYIRVIEDQAHEGTFNMAVDELLFRTQIETQDPNAVLRFYQFRRPTLTVGYGLWQTLHDTLGQLGPGTLEGIKDDLPRVRRLTGGGIVFHDSDLTYSLILPLNEHPALRKVRQSYFLIHRTLQKALDPFGIRTELFEGDSGPQCPMGIESFCFDNPVLYDLMLGDKKVAGGAQKRTLGYLLHQGSITWSRLMDLVPSLSSGAFIESFSACLADLLSILLKQERFDVEIMRSL